MGRDWDLGLFVNKLAGVNTFIVQSPSIKDIYANYMVKATFVLHFHCFSLKFILWHCERLSPLTVQHTPSCLFPANVKIDEVYFGAFSVNRTAAVYSTALTTMYALLPGEFSV